MGVNVNKEYSFFIIPETTMWIFFLFCTAFLKNTPVILNSLSFLTLTYHNKAK